MTGVDLVTFLRARLDEREAAAQLAAPWPWKLNAERDEVIAEDDELVANVFALSNNQLRNTATHIALNDPQFVLDDIAAKRQIVEHIADRLNPEEADDRWEGADAETDGMATFTLCALAAPFASHPDYDPAWAPREVTAMGGD